MIRKLLEEKLTKKCLPSPMKVLLPESPKQIFHRQQRKKQTKNFSAERSIVYTSLPVPFSPPFFF